MKCRNLYTSIKYCKIYIFNKTKQKKNMECYRDFTCSAFLYNKDFKTLRFKLNSDSISPQITACQSETQNLTARLRCSYCSCRRRRSLRSASGASVHARNGGHVVPLPRSSGFRADVPQGDKRLFEGRTESASERQLLDPSEVSEDSPCSRMSSCGLCEVSFSGPSREEDGGGGVK